MSSLKKATPPTERNHIPAHLGILASVLVAAAFVVANVPGNPQIGPAILTDGKYGPHFECGVQSVVHGWPFTCLTHEGVGTDSFGGTVSPWKVADGARFDGGAFFANIVVLVAVTFSANWIVRRHLRKHGWRFGLFHLLATTLFVAATLAFVASRSRLHESQIAKLHRNQNSEFAEWQPFGPYWLRLITGPRYWQWGDRLVAADIEHSDELADFPGASTIKLLTIWTIKCDSMPPLDDYKSLRAIDMSMVNYDFNDLELVGDGEPEFWPCLRVIARCKSIQGLNLHDCGVTDRGLRELARMPELKNLELAANQDVSDDGIANLMSMRSLKKLGLAGTSVTENGIKRLKRALPDCEVVWNGSVF